MLASLKQAGKQLIVATSKPEEFSIQILKHFGLYDYFDFVAGATMDRKRSKKRCYPVCLGAKWDYRFGAYHHDWRQGSTMCLALKRKSLILSVSFYGFGSREELEEAGATYIAQEVGEIAAL